MQDELKRSVVQVVSHTEREIDNDSLAAVEAESADVNSTSVTGEKENKVPVSSISSSHHQ